MCKEGYTFDEYEEDTSVTAAYPDLHIIIDGGKPIHVPWLYPLLGLMGESGEVCEKFKKILREEGGHIGPDKYLEIEKEAGDIIWYLDKLAKSLGTNLATIAKINVDKVLSRLKRGVVKGSGDNR